jgi:hypothetical protein
MMPGWRHMMVCLDPTQLHKGRYGSAIFGTLSDNNVYSQFGDILDVHHFSLVTILANLIVMLKTI